MGNSTMVVAKLYKQFKEQKANQEPLENGKIIGERAVLLRSYVEGFNDRNKHSEAGLEGYVIDEKATLEYYETRKDQDKARNVQDKFEELNKNTEIVDVLKAALSQGSKPKATDEDKDLRKELKAQADELGLEYAKNIKTDKLQALINENLED